MSAFADTIGKKGNLSGGIIEIEYERASSYILRRCESFHGLWTTSCMAWMGMWGWDLLRDHSSC
ncbi:hypothetical protein DRN79_01785 [Methanosarcinales archaeon]|nr:MAG: hypothetical protein DRN79_01785 [Methanosarcinales archaeon]